MRRAVALVCSLLLLSGCGLAQRATEKLVEDTVTRAVEEATGVSVDAEENEITIRGEEGEEFTLRATEGELPDGFPFAVYPGGKVTSSTTITTDGKKGWMVSIEFDADAGTVADFYEQAHREQGIEVSRTEMDMDGEVAVLLTGESETLSSLVTISREGSGPGTVAFILGEK
jgi:hypothetical protein